MSRLHVDAQARVVVVDGCNVTPYISIVTTSFKHKGLRRLYERGERQGIGPNMVSRVEELLSVLDAIESIEEMNIPGCRLHPLVGNLQGHWSVGVTGNWRIVFRFEDGEAFDVDLFDYH